MIVVRLCHCWVHTSWVDPSVNHGADIFYLLSLNLWWGRNKIHIETTKHICACSIHRMINVYCISLTLCSTYWTKLWWDPILVCFPGRQSMVDGGHGEGNECLVDFINQWSMFHSHLSYAIEVCPVNKIDNFSHCKSILVLINWSSSQRWNYKGCLTVPHECLWGILTCPWPMARQPCSGSL